jgi:linoleoyl-CoA desaturase
MSKKDRIKFPAANQSGFYDELKQKVSDYLKTKRNGGFGNLNLVIKTIVMIGLYTVPYILMYTGIYTGLWMFLLAWAVMGLGIAGMGMSVMHDANHKAYSGKKTVNMILGKSYISWEAFRQIGDINIIYCITPILILTGKMKILTPDRF